jgi:hypothetical protein
LPGNPAGDIQLRDTLASLRRAPPPRPVGPLPATAAAISGLTYRFYRNPLQVETLRLAFDGSAQAILHIKHTGEDELLSWPVGLTANYRLSSATARPPRRPAWLLGRP